jgi:hypothetical protein
VKKIIFLQRNNHPSRLLARYTTHLQYLCDTKVGARIQLLLLDLELLFGLLLDLVTELMLLLELDLH